MCDGNVWLCVGIGIVAGAGVCVSIGVCVDADGVADGSVGIVVWCRCWCC